MFIKYVIGLVAISLCLVSLGALSHSMTQKSTIITLNNDNINAPLVCTSDVTCELRNAGIDFIKRTDSLRIVLFKFVDTTAACEAGFRAGEDLVIMYADSGVDFPCAKLR